METKYSRKQFKGFTHRFIVEFDIGEENCINMDIYANSNSYIELEKFINENKAEKVISFKIVHCSSKEQDNLITDFLNKNFLDE